MEDNKVVYIHKTKDNNIFYVGCGDTNRAYETQCRKKDWWLIANSGYVVEIVKENLTEKDAFILENKLILKYGKINNNTGILVNKYDGYKVKEKKYKYPYKKLKFNDRKVINYETKEIYNTIEEASKKYKIHINTLVRYLEKKSFNSKIKLCYLE